MASARRVDGDEVARVRVSRWLELSCGVLADVGGLVGPGYLFLVADPALLREAGVGTVIFLALVALALAGVVAGAVAHSRATGPQGRGLLGGATVFLAGLALFSLPSIGIALVPSVLFALAACALAFARGASRAA